MRQPNPPLRLSQAALELIAARFRALGEPSRLALILALESGERHVSQLVQATGLAQANVSRHLQTLTEAGLLGRRKDGSHVFYFVADRDIFKLCDAVCGSLHKRLRAQATALA